MADDIARMVGELGPAWRDVSVVTKLEEGIWAVLLSDGVTFGLTEEAEDGRLVVSTDLGPVAAPHRLEAYEAMLNWTLLAPDTGGLRFGLVGDERSVELSAVLPNEGLSLAELCQVLGEFTDVVREWQPYLASPGNAPPPMPQGVIRA